MCNLINTNLLKHKCLKMNLSRRKYNNFKTNNSLLKSKLLNINDNINCIM